MRACRQHAAAAWDAAAAPTVFVVMGVSGCGKSTVGQALAQALNASFEDADTYHPTENIAKMAAGVPLTDADRWPWLLRLQALVQQHASSGRRLVLACSALKPAYRRVLQGASAVEASAAQPTTPPSASGRGVAYVLLDPPREVLLRRLQERAAAGAHFMPPKLLESQLAALDYEAQELFLHVTAAAARGPTDGATQRSSRRSSSSAHGAAAPRDGGSAGGGGRAPATEEGVCSVGPVAAGEEARFPSVPEVVALVMQRLLDSGGGTSAAALA